MQTMIDSGGFLLHENLSSWDSTPDYDISFYISTGVRSM